MRRKEQSGSEVEKDELYPSLPGGVSAVAGSLILAGVPCRGLLAVGCWRLDCGGGMSHSAVHHGAGIFGVRRLRAISEVGMSPWMNWVVPH